MQFKIIFKKIKDSYKRFADQVYTLLRSMVADRLIKLEEVNYSSFLSDGLGELGGVFELLYFDSQRL